MAVKRKQIHVIILYTLSILYLLISLLPYMWGFITSLKPSTAVNSLSMANLSFKNYFFIIENFPFGRWFINSFFIAAAITFLNLIINSLAGYSLARINFKGRNFVFIVILATMMIPNQVTVAPLFVILARMGWINTYKGLIIPFAFSYFHIFLFRQFFLSLPKCLEEAAVIDGVSRWGIFWRIIVPISKPAFVSSGIIVFTWSWNNFFWPSLLAKSEDMYTLPVGLNSFLGQYYSFWDQVLAGSMILAIPAIIVFLIFQKKFIAGAATTGLKE